MAERSILQLGDPILWQQSVQVTQFETEAQTSLIRDLEDTLAAFRSRNGFGRGIAAPQIGELQRVIFVRMKPDGFSGPLINPRVTWQNSQYIELWDNCFSFPDLVVKVRRSSEVRVEYQDLGGTERNIEASGVLSELLQHEIDHLDGILATDRAISPRAFMTKRQYELYLGTQG
jgi:peptide deformylase